MSPGQPLRTAGSAQMALDAVASALDAQQTAIAQGDASGSGINQRGVTALFGPSATYGAGGNAAVDTPSRSLRLA